MTIRRVVVQPIPPAFDCDGLELRGRHSGRDGGVVDINDGREIGFGRVADFHSCSDGL